MELNGYSSPGFSSWLCALLCWECQRLRGMLDDYKEPGQQVWPGIKHSVFFTPSFWALWCPGVFLAGLPLLLILGSFQNLETRLINPIRVSLLLQGGPSMDERAVGEKNQGNQTQSSKSQYQWCHPFVSLCRNWPLRFLFFISKKLALSLGWWKAEQTCLYPPVSLSPVCNTRKPILIPFYKNILPDSNQPITGTSTGLFPFSFLLPGPSSNTFLYVHAALSKSFQGLSRKFPSPEKYPSPHFFSPIRWTQIPSPYNPHCRVPAAWGNLWKKRAD